MQSRASNLIQPRAPPWRSWRQVVSVAAGSGPVVVASVVIIYVLCTLFGEKIKLNDGLGWDGFIYFREVVDLPGLLSRREIDDYYIQRIIPVALVRVALDLGRWPRDAAHVIAAFEAANIALVLVSACAWTGIARQLGLNARGRWLGAVALFGNYGFLKWSSYYPVLADVWGVATGLVTLLLFLRRRWITLCLSNLIVGFIWPSALQVGTLLLALGTFGLGPSDCASPSIRKARATLPAIVAISAILATALWIWECERMLAANYQPSSGCEPLQSSLVRLSLLISSAAVFGGVAVLVADSALWDVRRLLRQTLRWQPLAALIGYVVVVMVRRWLAPHASTLSDPGDFLRVTSFTALQKPGGFLIAHTLFAGPIVLVMVTTFRKMVTRMRRFDPAASALGLLGLLFFLNSETRRIWNLLAMLTPFAVKAMDDLPWTRKDLAIFAGLTLLSSNVWLTLSGNETGETSTFPGQLLFMTVGPWMTSSMYLAQGLLVAAAAVWIWRLPRRP